MILLSRGLHRAAAVTLSRCRLFSVRTARSAHVLSRNLPSTGALQLYADTKAAPTALRKYPWEAKEEHDFQQTVAPLSSLLLEDWRHEMAKAADLSRTARRESSQAGDLAYHGLLQWHGQLSEEEMQMAFDLLSERHLQRTTREWTALRSQVDAPPNYLGRLAWELLARGQMKALQKLRVLVEKDSHSQRGLSWRLATAFVAQSALSTSHASKDPHKLLAGLPSKLLSGSFRLSLDDKPAIAVAAVLEALSPAKRNRVIGMIRLFELREFWRAVISQGRLEVKLKDWRHAGLLKKRSAALWNALSDRNFYHIPIEWADDASHADGLCITPSIVIVFFRIFTQLRMDAEEATIWRFLAMHNLRPSELIWQARLQGLIDARRVADVQIALESLDAATLPPHVLLDAVDLLVGSKRASARRTADNLLQVLGSAEAIRSPRDCGRFVAHLLRAGLFGRAQQYLEAAKDRLEGSLDAVAERVVASFSDKADFDAAKFNKCLHFLAANGIQPASKTHLYEMRAKLLNGDIAGTRKLLGEIDEPATQRMACQMLVAHLCSTKRPADLKRARALLEWMSARGIATSVQSHTAVIAAYCDEAVTREKTPQKADALLRKALRAFQQMRLLNIRPNRVTYDALFRAHLARGSSKSLARAQQGFRRLQLSRASDTSSLYDLRSSWRNLLLGLHVSGRQQRLKRKLMEVRTAGEPLKGDLLRTVTMLEEVHLKTD